MWFKPFAELDLHIAFFTLKDHFADIPLSYLCFCFIFSELYRASFIEVVISA